MNRPKRDRRWQSPRDRAQVAAELIEEAEALSDRCLIATPAELVKATRPRPIQVLSSGPVTEPTPASQRPSAAESSPPAQQAPIQQDRELTLAALDGALRGQPDDATLLMKRAALCASIGDYSAARRDLDRVLRVTPDNAEALTALGVLLSRRGLWTDAAALLRRAVTADGARSDAWCYLGEALNHVDDLSDALAAFTRASELQPGNAKAFHGQGIVLDRLNRPEDATRMYRRAREVSRR